MRHGVTDPILDQSVAPSKPRASPPSTDAVHPRRAALPAHALSARTAAPRAARTAGPA